MCDKAAKIKQVLGVEEAGGWMGTATYSEVLITVPFNPPLRQSGELTASHDLSGRRNGKGRESVQEDPLLPIGVSQCTCNSC